jgi:dihydroxyacetone kinase
VTRITDDPAGFKDDWLAGYTAAYARYVQPVPGASGVMLAGGARGDKVGVVLGGGCGHYPAFAGLVGPGLADGAVVGDIFTSPSAEQAYRVGRHLEGGAGVVFAFGNYAGDTMNFGVARNRLRADGVDARIVLVTDDVASAPAERASTRRGIAGGLFVFKALGAASARGDAIGEVERLGRLANDRTRTFGVAFAGCTFPGATEPLFTVPAGKVELGLGIHGESGVRTVDDMTAEQLAATLVQPLLDERPVGAGRRAAVVLNGLGDTKYEEMFVLYRHVDRLLTDAGVEAVLPEVGEFVTSLDMAGTSLSLCWLDDELAQLWAAPADTPTFKRGNASELPTFAPRPVPADAIRLPGADVGEASEQSQQAAGTVRSMLSTMLRVVTDNADELGRIDAVAGDGDHGTGMTRGLRAADAAAAAADARGGVGAVLGAAGRAWADKAGGTSGVLWGLFLETAGQRLGNTDDPSAGAVADAVAAGLHEMAEIGGARAGDKTLLDALIPFSDTLTERTGAGEPLAQAWTAAAEVATRAARDTADLVPKVGRARPLADKSRGTPDAGATSLAMLAEAVGELLRGDGR